MKRNATLVLGVVALCAVSAAAQARLDGAYKFVSVSFPGGSQTEADQKGMIVVHGKHWANVRSAVGRKSWTQEVPESERAKKVVAAFQGLTAGCGTFEVQGSTITMRQEAGANPGAVGTSSKWEYKLDGKTLRLQPLATQGVEFQFEKLP